MLLTLCTVDLDDYSLLLICRCWWSNTDLQNFRGELSPQEDELVELEEEDDGVAVGKLHLLVLYGDIHDVLERSDHCRQHDDGPRRSVRRLNVAHQEHEEVLDLRECGLCLGLDGGLHRTGLPWRALPIVDVRDAVQCCLGQVVLLLLLLPLILISLLRFQDHPSDSSNCLGKHI